MNGANRLGGNSLADLLVFGRRAGVAAAQYALGKTARVDPEPAEVALAETGDARTVRGARTARTRSRCTEDLQKIMMETSASSATRRA